MRVWVGLAVACVSLAAWSDNSAPGARAGTVGELRFWTSPGKPMQLGRRGEPAERITARKDGGRATLTVMRNVGDEYEEASAPLSDGEWRALEAAVAAHGLAAWKPRPSRDGNVFDYSTSGFTLRAPGGALVNEQSWSRPVDNAGDAWAVSALLAKLARAKVGKPLLFYLTP